MWSKPSSSCLSSTLRPLLHLRYHHSSINPHPNHHRSSTSFIHMAHISRTRSLSDSPASEEDAPPSSKRARLDLSTPINRSSHSHPGPELYKPGVYLAPMVRIGTLPTRLLALEYGADLVWGPEIVDRAIIGSTRMVDLSSGTIQYTKNSGASSIWQTHPIE